MLDREEVITRAASLAYSDEMAAKRRETLSEHAKSSRFEHARDRLLAAALDDLVLDGLADEEVGEAEIHGHYYYARIDQWIVSTSDGFVLVKDFNTIPAARQEFEKISEHKRTEARI